MNVKSWKVFLSFLITADVVILVYFGCQYAVQPKMLALSAHNQWQPLDHINCVHKCDTLYADRRITCTAHASCLASIIREKCMDGNPVPNVVHYVWFRSRELAFHNMISMMATVKFIQPCHVVIHGDAIPYGEWWDYMLSKVNASAFIHIPREHPTSIFGHQIYAIEHRSDVARLEILNEYGGIYLDTDYVPVRSFTQLRKYDMTLGKESANALCNGVIISKAGSKFITFWYDSYKTFNDRQWGMHSVRKPYQLSQTFPQYIHIEDTSLHRPHYNEIDDIYKHVISFEKKYGIHLWFRFYNIHHNADDVKQLNSTYGLLCRMLLYNTTNLMER